MPDFEILENIAFGISLLIIFGIFLYGSLVGTMQRFPKYRTQLIWTTSASVIALLVSIVLVGAGYSEYVYDGALRWLTLVAMIWMLIVVLLGFSASLFVSHVNFFHYYRKIDKSGFNITFSKKASFFVLLTLVLVSVAIAAFTYYAQNAY